MKFEKFYSDNLISHAENCIAECNAWRDREQVSLVRRAIAMDMQSMFGGATPYIDYAALEKLNTLYASVKAIEESL